MHIRVSRAAGWTLVEIMIAVSLIGMLASISVPSFLRARDTASLNAIRSNLRLIDEVKQQWALETRSPTSVEPVESDLQGYFKTGTMPESVIGETYNINPLDEPASATVPFAFAGYAAGAEVILE
jgi:prepilin-type N-terminal cleavage/methylation domain-containing protein